MLARFVLALLLAAFAMPVAAPAACHEAVTTTAATTMIAAHHAMPTSDHDDPPARSAPAHGCIGCIPPSDWASARIVAPLVAPATARAEIALRLDLARGSAPMLRPPRRG